MSRASSRRWGSRTEASSSSILARASAPAAGSCGRRYSAIDHPVAFCPLFHLPGGVRTEHLRREHSIQLSGPAARRLGSRTHTTAAPQRLRTRSPFRNMPTSTARSVRSSSQSISNSANVRLCGLLQNSPIRSARSKSGSMRTWRSSARRAGSAWAHYPRSEVENRSLTAVLKCSAQQAAVSSASLVVRGSDRFRFRRALLS